MFFLWQLKWLLGCCPPPAALLNEVCRQSGEHRLKPAQAPKSRNLLTDGQLLESGSADEVLASHSQVPSGGPRSLKIIFFFPGIWFFRSNSE